MSKKKLLIGLGATLLVISAVVVILFIPSGAKAQGWIEYVYCGLDSGAPVHDDFLVEAETIREFFGLDEWQTNWGFVVTCDVKFRKNIFTKVTMCNIVYEDLEVDERFFLGDKKVVELCGTIKY